MSSENPVAWVADAPLGGTASSALSAHTVPSQARQSHSWKLSQNKAPLTALSPVAPKLPAPLSRGFSGGVSDSEDDEPWGVEDGASVPVSPVPALQGALLLSF